MEVGYYNRGRAVHKRPTSNTTGGKCRAQRKEPTYEDLIIFDRPAHEVSDEIKAVDTMNQPDQCLQMYSDGSVKNNDERWHVRLNGSEKR